VQWWRNRLFWRADPGSGESVALVADEGPRSSHATFRQSGMPGDWWRSFHHILRWVLRQSLEQRLLGEKEALHRL
jgi:hypothetical protein